MKNGNRARLCDAVRVSPPGTLWLYYNTFWGKSIQLFFEKLRQGALLKLGQSFVAENLGKLFGLTKGKGILLANLGTVAQKVTVFCVAEHSLAHGNLRFRYIRQNSLRGKPFAGEKDTIGIDGADKPLCVRT